MKQRFSYLDLRLVVNEWHSELVGLRLQNIYSLEASNRFLLFKYDGKISKTFMVADPGYRIHLTQFQHPTTMQPSGFVAKLRKHLKSRKLTRLWVAPDSRLLVCTFNEGQYKLVFEFFAGGNVLLLDESNAILALMRSVKGSDSYLVGRTYETALPGDTDPESMISNEAAPAPIADIETVKSWLGKDKIGKAVFSKVPSASLSLVEYCLTKEGVDPKSKEGDPEAIRKALQHAVQWAHDLMNKAVNPGFVLKGKDGVSLEFEAFREYFEQELQKDESLSIASYETYNKTIDDYFGAVISDRQVNRTEQLHQVAEGRLAAARSERENRIKSLDLVQEQNEERGEALQTHAELVSAAIASVNQLIQQGVDWVDIGNLIKLETQKGNNIAKHIKSLDLAHNSIVLRLPAADALEESSDDELFSDDEESGTADRSPKTIDVKISLDKTPWANARDYFEIRRAAGAKKEKTAQQADVALKSAEKKIKRDLQVNLQKSEGTSHALRSLRDLYWFEKFYWFITSDGYLAIGGRDALQNDLLLSRYFSQNDAVVYCDVPKASLVIVKNKSPTEVSPQAIDQAGAFTVASSQSWETKSLAPAWYIYRKDVPKLNEDGTPTRTRDIEISPSRKTVYPSNFEMGISVLWQKAYKSVAGDDGDEAAFAQDFNEDEEFPDTQLQSDDDDFPDTNVDSENEFNGEISDGGSNVASPVATPRVGNKENDAEVDKGLEEKPEKFQEEEWTDEGSREASPSSGAPVEDLVKEEEFDDLLDKELEHLKDEEVSDGASREASPASGAPAEDLKAEAVMDSELDGRLESLKLEEEAEANDSSFPDRARSGSPALSNGPKVRGKSKKTKKMKRYADQDEEDRQRAMEKLGTLRGLQRIEQEKQERDAKKQQELEWKKMKRERAEKAELERITGDVFEDTPFPADLASKPPADEQLLNAVGMFGPWNSLKSVPYKIKVTPGPMKKGKAVSEALRVILNAKDTSPTKKQEDLVAGIRQTDLQQCVPVGKLQLSMPGNAKAGKTAKGVGSRGSKANKKKK